MEPILQVTNLNKRYSSIQAVKNLSFSVKRGSVFGILGPNGSGKSTTLGILTGVVNQNSGDFQWFNGKFEKPLLKIGTLLERPNFYGYMRADDNLKIIADIRGTAHAEIDSIFEMIGLETRKRSRFKTFSFGMQQRLAIGAALLGNPEVLILDEPTNGLDPQGIAEIREIISRIAQTGKTIILASHILDEVQKVCTEVLIMKKGMKLFDGKVNELGSSSPSVELGAPDELKLVNQLVRFEDYKNHKIEGGIVLAEFNNEINLSELNNWFFGNGIILSHLSAKKFSLEQEFLELLKKTEKSNV